MSQQSITEDGREEGEIIEEEEEINPIVHGMGNKEAQPVKNVHPNGNVHNFPMGSCNSMANNKLWSALKSHHPKNQHQRHFKSDTVSKVANSPEKVLIIPSLLDIETKPSPKLTVSLLSQAPPPPPSTPPPLPKDPYPHPPPPPPLTVPPGEYKPQPLTKKAVLDLQPQNEEDEMTGILFFSYETSTKMLLLYGQCCNSWSVSYMYKVAILELVVHTL